MADRWKRLRSEARGDFRIFSVREDYYTHPEKDGERSFYVIEASDWVNVIAVTEDDRIVFIRQQRPGVGAVRLEIPGGIIEEGEEPAVAAARELAEETGYRGEPPVLICTTEPNPATHDNRCFSFLVRNATLEGGTDLDHDEVIDVELRSATGLAALIEGGELTHALLQLPLMHYLRWRETGHAPEAMKKAP
ncbi:MAG: NUDIX hydrolase [Planctomycetota bacterium]|jgi:8-oxo-dGTP pyrophosphatase MutT (NUDIX family)